MKHYIYKITDTITDEYYIGSKSSYGFMWKYKQIDII